jgi:hypothetical protein
MERYSRNDNLERLHSCWVLEDVLILIHDFDDVLVIKIRVAPALGRRFIAALPVWSLDFSGDSRPSHRTRVPCWSGPPQSADPVKLCPLSIGVYILLYMFNPTDSISELNPITLVSGVICSAGPLAPSSVCSSSSLNSCRVLFVALGLSPHRPCAPHHH